MYARVDARIARFQRDVLRFPHPDRRVDPNGRMIKVLLARANDAARARRVAAQNESWTQGSRFEQYHKQFGGKV